MRPTGTRVWRKAARRTLRGIPTGRRATPTYGPQQTKRDRVAEFIAAGQSAKTGGQP